MQWKRIFSVVKRDKELNLPYKLSSDELSSFFHIPSEQSTLLYRYLHSTSPAEKYQSYKEQGIHIITPFDRHFPNRLTHMYDTPWVLYAIGDCGLLDSSYHLAVVGTRKPSDYGRHALEYLLPPLIRKGVTTISGLARGSDALAHHITMKENGKTIAVLGSGLHHIYPREHTALAKKISTDHLLLSEYPPDQPPRKWQFPMRNRIISALSDVTFISEAGARSGSLITAYQALEQGKKVRVLPGTIFSSVSKGTNQLIYEGATPVLEPKDLWHDRWK